MSMSAHSYIDFVADPRRSTTISDPPLSPSRLPEPPIPTDNDLDIMPIGFGAHYTGPISRPPSAHTQHRHSSTPSNNPPQWLWREPTEDEIMSIHQLHKTSVTPNELEMSRPPSPRGGGASADMVQTLWNPPMNKWRVLSGCMIYLGNGMNDSAPGALLPYMEKYYNIGYAIVSLIFIANAVGFILAAFFVHALDGKLGRARTLMLCDAVLIIAHIMMAVTPPFPVFVVGFFICGLAMATNLALNNVFIANLASSTVLLGLSQGAYGIGGIIGPIIATSLVTHGTLFSRYYCIMIGIRLLSLVSVGAAFWNFERDSPTSPTIPAPTELLTPLERAAIRPKSNNTITTPISTPTTPTPSQTQSLLTAISNRTTLMGALFIFAYQGAEVSISGWVISFLLTYRSSTTNPTSSSAIGYVTAGFWAGITLGRFFLTPVASRWGEKKFVYTLTFGAILFQLLTWLVPNIIGDSVAIAVVGLLLGPVYPAAVTVFARLLPRGSHNTALAFIASAGSSGGAIAPFLTGLGAQVKGIWVLHPVCIGLFVGMELCWVLLPRVGKRRE